MTELARAHRVMPGGVLGVFSPPIAIDRGEGCRVYDTRGREYVDCVLGSGPLILGHRPAAVVDAIARQARRGTQYFVLSEPAIRLAEELAAAIPCAERVRLTNTGSEATDLALRLARAFTGRDRIMRFRGSYHGYHDYAQSGASAGIPSAVAETVITAPFNDLEATGDLIEANRDLSAVIVEPAHRAIAPRPGFLEGLRAMTERLGILLVFDEVVTGFRLGWGGGQERYGVLPDLATYGKIIGGGLPLGAVAGRADVMELTDPHRNDERYTFFQGTLAGNPLAAAAGLATLEVLRDGAAYGVLERTGDALRRALRAVAERAPVPLTVYGEGALVGLAVADPARRLLQDALLEHGVLVNLAARFYLSTEHGPAEVERIAQAVDDALEVLA